MFHSSPATRPLTQLVVHRLAELGEHPYVLSDRDEEKHEEGVSYVRLRKENCELTIAEIREQVSRRRNLGRLFIDVAAVIHEHVGRNVFDQSPIDQCLAIAEDWQRQPGQIDALQDRMHCVATIANNCLAADEVKRYGTAGYRQLLQSRIRKVLSQHCIKLPGTILVHKIPVATIR